MPVRYLLRNPIQMVRLHRPKPVWSEPQDFFVEMIFRRFAMHQIPHMNNAGADGPGVRRNRRESAWLDELNLISFRVFRLKPVAPIASGAKFAEPVDTMGAEVRQQAVCIRGVISDAGHPAEGMLRR